MGDRANCVIHQKWNDDDDATPVWLYTHWGGSGLKETVQRALARHLRWDNPPYLTRIIFDGMTHNRHGEETGFGISTSAPDNDHPYVVVEPHKQTVSLQNNNGEVLNSWSFEDFIEQKL